MTPTGSSGPGCGAHERQQHHRYPNFARILSRSFFETPQKRCNSNDAHSMFEKAAGELRAKLMGGGGAWPCFKATHRAEGSQRGQRAGGPPPTAQPGTTGVESAGGAGGPGCGVRGQQGLARQHTDTPTDWRPPRGLRGLAGLRADAPSEARGADGERAGRRPRAHKATRPCRKS